jgi:hypothetical protein
MRRLVVEEGVNISIVSWALEASFGALDATIWSFITL